MLCSTEQLATENTCITFSSDWPQPETPVLYLYLETILLLHQLNQTLCLVKIFFIAQLETVVEVKIWSQNH